MVALDTAVFSSLHRLILVPQLMPQCVSSSTLHCAPCHQHTLGAKFRIHCAPTRPVSWLGFCVHSFALRVYSYAFIAGDVAFTFYRVWYKTKCEQGDDGFPALLVHDDTLPCVYELTRAAFLEHRFPFISLCYRRSQTLAARANNGHPNRHPPLNPSGA